ncbi:MAG: YiiX/YebB-like N1pC/P60 family cysteine hydrolase [Flavobacteriales bacterium]|jgi:aspartate carbamoyltransferase regulatory subunit|nr:YiiX/YebB-like N1pC/P60 family cysteine hydrolase [Flavobacteriales bacterium]
MKKYFYLLFTILISCTKNFKLQEGDLLFQDLDSSPLCDAIELVTPGYNGANFSHIGLVVLDNDTLKVLEAIPPKVMITNLDDFINRSFDKNGNPKVIVGRLKKEFTNSISNAVSYSKSKLEITYDEVFLINNETYYCSELIFEAFEKDSIFQLKPMTFLHPKTKDTLKVWKEYYSDLNTNIPEGNPGINPGIMSLSNKIEMVHFYGIPDGLNN